MLLLECKIALHEGKWWKKIRRGRGFSSKARLVARIRPNQAPGMQSVYDWMSVRMVEPGSPDAKGALEPGSCGASNFCVSPEPGSWDASRTSWLHVTWQMQRMNNQT